ncbi:IclR family transcriptional regulator [Ornithinimicrobium cavernae]|uniref:IclR family transcriptional regulator n=1 Tax=Ornithinimicrobium cavernae TaxID=2666047 RepID=UPI001379ADFA|nr:IclR family transcriptional regulator [Ornithinimicrobium cavernae]
MNSTSPPPVQSVKRALDVLFLFDDHESVLTPARAATRLGLNRTTAWRYLQTLASSGLVREAGETGRFALGGRTVALADAYTRQWGEFGTVGGIALVGLRDRTGETAALHIRQGWTRVVLRQVESRHELHRTYRDIGQPISLLLGSPSLAILSHLDPGERTAYLQARTDLDARARAAVESQLAEIRTLGYATSESHRAANLASIAAPVRDPAGAVLGALNITGPDHRFTPEARREWVPEVIASARWVEHALREHPAEADPASTDGADSAPTAPTSQTD